MKTTRTVKNKKNIAYYMNLNYKVEVMEDKEEGVSMNQYCLYLITNSLKDKIVNL